MGGLERWHDDVYTVSRPFHHITGLDLGCRMTIVRTPIGLWIHSPVPMEAGWAAEVDALGEVKWIVAPNQVHYLYLKDAVAKWPAAKVYGPDSLRKKYAGPLLDTAEAPWAEWLPQRFVRGMPWIDETVFVHAGSKTLIVTDLATFVDDKCAPSYRFAAKLGFTYGKVDFPIPLRFAFVRDRKVMREDVAAIAAWDFDRIVLSHGSVVETEGKALFAKAHGWLLA
jgi:hypothetical protein